MKDKKAKKKKKGLKPCTTITPGLTDAIVIIPFIETDDSGDPFPTTVVHRFNLIGEDTKAFLKHLKKFKGIVEGGQMLNV